MYDSSFSSGITPVKNIANKTDQQETEGTKMDSTIKTTESGFAASVDLGGAMSDQESERLSETFSFQPVNRKRSDSQSVGTQKRENEIGHKSEDVENKMSNDYNLVVTGMEMKESASVQKSKTNDINNSDSTECRARNLQKSTNDSGVSVGGRSSIIDHSKAQESKSAQKLQETKTTDTGMNEEFEKSHSIGKNSDDNSWASGGSYGDKKRKERTPVQNGSPVDSARQNKVDSKSDNSDSTKKMPKKSCSNDVSEESSDDNEEDVQTTSVKATGQVGRKDSEQKLSEVNKSETSSIHSESSKSLPRSKTLKKAEEVEKGNSKKPKIISIKFTKPIEASPACEIKTEVVDLCDSDGESSWTESSEMNTPKKTPQAEDGDSKGNGKSSQVKGNDGKDKAMEAADDFDNESNDSSQASDNEKAFTQAPASDHATGVKNMVDTTAHKLNSLDKYGKVKTLDAASDSDSDSEDSDGSSEKPLTQPAKTGGKPKHSINDPLSTPNGSNKKAKAKTTEVTSESDDESSDNSSEKSLKTIPASTSGKSKDPVNHPVAGTSNGSNKVTAKTPEADNDSDNESSDSSSEEPFKQPPAKTRSKSKGAASNPTRSSKSSDKKPTARTMVSAEVDFNSDTKHAGKTIDNSDSTGNLNTQNAAEMNAKSAQSKGNAKRSVSPKRNGKCGEWRLQIIRDLKQMYFCKNMITAINSRMHKRLVTVLLAVSGQGADIYEAICPCN